MKCDSCGRYAHNKRGRCSCGGQFREVQNRRWRKDALTPKLRTGRGASQ